MIVYLIELAYDISINTLDNVSTNLGFESVVGFFLHLFCCQSAMKIKNIIQTTTKIIYKKK